MAPRLSKALVRIQDLLDRFYYEAGGDTARLADPEIVGPLVSPILRVAGFLLMSTAISSSIIAPLAAYYQPALGVVLVLLSVFSLILAEILPRLWRYILAQGLDGELPGVLLYLVPYTASPRYVADVIAGLPPRIFRWFQHESARLRFLMEMGLDPVTALERLAETTPSRRLREILEEYTGLQVVGATSSESSVRLLDRGLRLVREKWRGYVEAGRALVEIVVALLVSIVALAPLSGSTFPALLLVSLGLHLSGGLLLLMRPPLGDMPRSRVAVPLYFLSLFASTALALWVTPFHSLAVLSVSAVILEILAFRRTRAESRALRSLIIAAEKARFGLDYQDELEEAEALGTPIRAVRAASAIAGGIGVGQALKRLARVVEEAISLKRRVSLEGAVMEGISMAAPAILAVVMGKMSALLSGGQLISAGSLPGVEGVMALAPLAVVPAEILRRGYTPSTLASAFSLLGVMIVSGYLKLLTALAV